MKISPTVSLGSSVQIIAGTGFPEILQGKRGGKFPFYKVGDISENWKRGATYLHAADHYVDDEDLLVLKAKPLPPGAVVFAKIGAAIGLNRRAITTVSSLVDNNVFALIPNASMLDLRFLFHYMCSVDLMPLARATTVPSLRKGDIADLQISLPPLPTQHRIVAEIEEKLSHLDAAHSALLRAQANLKRYRASVLAQACHLDSHELPAGWKRTKLGELATIGTGSTPKRDQPSYWQDGTVPWVTSGVVNDKIVNEPSDFITEKALNETNCKLFPAGTLLVAMYGEGKTRGMCSELAIPAATNQALAAIQTSDKLRAYLKTALQAAYEQTRRTASGGVQPNLNLSLVRAIPIALPPDDQIPEIVTEVESRLSVIDSTEATLRTQLARAKRLRQSILQQAFSAPNEISA